MNAEKTSPKSLIEAVRYFSNPVTAIGFFAPLRWPKGVTCPHCGSQKVSYLKVQKRWQCHTKHPKRQFSAKVGTIMEDSPLPLEHWLVAIWLETNAKNSISSYEVARALEITQKSAWFMLHRIRLALQSGSFDKLSGVVEADETYVGGKAKNVHAKKRKSNIRSTGGGDKTTVLGLLARGGDVRTQVVAIANKPSIHDIIHKNVEPGSTIYTDAYKAYRSLKPEYVHDFVDHTVQYVKGQVHTNGLENFWALFKRCIKGTHVSVEPCHLFRYLDSECFRFNNRKMSDGQRFQVALKGVSGKRLTYKSLISAMPVRERIAFDNAAESDDSNLPN